LLFVLYFFKADVIKSIILIYKKGGMDLDHLENALDNL